MHEMYFLISKKKETKLRTKLYKLPFKYVVFVSLTTISKYIKLEELQNFTS